MLSTENSKDDGSSIVENRSQGRSNSNCSKRHDSFGSSGCCLLVNPFGMVIGHGIVPGPSAGSERSLCPVIDHQTIKGTPPQVKGSITKHEIRCFFGSSRPILVIVWIVLVLLRSPPGHSDIVLVYLRNFFVVATVVILWQELPFVLCKHINYDCCKSWS